MVRRFTMLSAATSALLLTGLVAAAAPAEAVTYTSISGAGSTWAQNAVEQWRKNVQDLYGLSVGYAGTGSSDGRNQFRNGTVDFAVSDIPYGLTDGGVVDAAPTRGYTYIPIAAGGTSFMYNLTIDGEQVTALRLSGSSLAKIFTRGITSWADPQIASENPGLKLPDIPVVPVVRGDGSGSTAQFTAWLASQHTAVWDAHCVAAGRTLSDGHCGQTSVFPTTTGYVVQVGSLGVSGYVSQSTSGGTITFVEYSYAANAGFPTAKVLNSAGYYVGPTSTNVGVALLDAGVRTDVPESDPAYGTADLEAVYASADPRSYPLSGYSYLIAPTAVDGTFTSEKGKSLGAFAYYGLCEGQQQTPRLGFGLLPANVVMHGLDEVKRIPGVDPATVTLAGCTNPALSAGADTLKSTAPMPAACDRNGPLQCGTAKAAVPAPSVATPARFTLSSAFSPTWSSLAAYGMTSYDVRHRTAKRNGSWVTGTTRTTTKRTTSLSVSPGSTVCASVRGRDALGNVGTWSAYRCQARPVDDRVLAGTDWSRTRRTGAYLGTVSRTTVLGRSLATTVVGKTFALVATRCSTCGKVRVFDGTRLIATVDLRSSTTRLRSVIALPTLTLRTHTLRVKVATSGKRVEIDGLGVSRV